MEAGKGNEKQGDGEGSFPLLRIRVLRVFKTFPAVAQVRAPSGLLGRTWANCSVTLSAPSSSTICGVSQLSCAQQRGSGAGKTLLLGTGGCLGPGCLERQENPLSLSPSHPCLCGSSAISCLLGPTA